MLMTQFLFSFYPPDFPSNISITYLLNALQHIFWMTANLITLNTKFRTEFLFIGLEQPLAKIQTCTLNTIPLTLLVSMTNISLFFWSNISTIQILLFSHCELRYGISAPVLNSKLPIKSPPPLSTVNLTTVTYSLYYNLPYSQLNRLQQIQNCLHKDVRFTVTIADMLNE